MTNRRTFIKKTALATTATSILPLSTFATGKTPYSGPNISLAQWSLNRAFFKGDLDPNDFASIASKSFGIKAIEYVNQFYIKQGHNDKFWMQMKANADDEGVKSLLIMVDSEGDLGDPKDKKRKTAVENHFKWIHAAKLLGCHSIRVNAFGTADMDTLTKTLTDGLGQLAAYGQKEGINVIVENHGLHTSNAAFMVDIIKKVDNPFLGTLPDFGNWCLNAAWGSTQNNKCTEVYDPLKGLTAFLPFAKGVSAKSYSFDEEGNETIIDYQKLLKIVKDSGFDGYIGIEYEGENMDEPDGIRATKGLIERTWKKLI